MRILTTLAFLTLSLLLGGCATPLRCGDARVAYTRGGLVSMSGYAVLLPPISLAHTGTTKFRVTGLPAAHYTYSLGMNGGYHYGRYNITDPQTRVAIRCTAPDGTTLLQTEIKRVDLELAPGSGVHTGGSLSIPELSEATSYWVYVTVLQPAQDPNETMRIGGFGPTNR